MNFIKIRKFLFWSVILIVVCVVLGFSAWHHWNSTLKPFLSRMIPISPIATITHGGQIRYIAFDPKNPELIATAGSDNFVKVWNRNRLDFPQLTLEVKKDSDGTVMFVGLAFSPIDNWIVTKTFWTLEIWDSTTGEKINTLHIASGDFAVSPIVNNMASDNVNIKLWDANDPKNIKGTFLLPPMMGWDSISLDGLERIDPYPKENINILRHNIPTDYKNECVGHRYRAIDFSPDEDWIAAAGETLERLDKDNWKWVQNVKIWDLQKQKLSKIIERDKPKVQEPKGSDKEDPAVNTPTSNEARSIQFSPDGRFFGLAADNGFTIWSLPDWNIYHEVLDQRIKDIAFSPNGTMFAVVDPKGITLWSIETLKPIALLQREGFLNFATSIAFSPDGNTLAGGCFDGVLGLWDVSHLYEN